MLRGHSEVRPSLPIPHETLAYLVYIAGCTIHCGVSQRRYPDQKKHAYTSLMMCDIQFDGRGMRVREARAHLWKICDEIIEERLEQQKRGELEDGGDFLTQLLPNVADKQVARESMFALLFAGQESLLNLLCWSLYELSRSPTWRARMRQEGQEQNPTGAIVGYNALHVRFPIIFQWRL